MMIIAWLGRYHDRRRLGRLVDTINEISLSFLVMFDYLKHITVGRSKEEPRKRSGTSRREDFDPRVLESFLELLVIVRGVFEGKMSAILRLVWRNFKPFDLYQMNVLVWSNFEPNKTRCGIIRRIDHLPAERAFEKPSRTRRVPGAEGNMGKSQGSRAPR